MPIPDVPLNWMANSAVNRPRVIGTTAMAQSRCRDLQAFDRRQHADRRRDDAVAEQQPRPEHQRPQQERRAAPFVLMQEAVKREHAAFAVVLRAQNKDRVFKGDNDRDRPDHERYAAQHVGGRLRTVGAAEEQLIHRVERRSADIAVHDAERAERQTRKSAVRCGLLGRPAGRRFYAGTCGGYSLAAMTDRVVHVRRDSSLSIIFLA